MTPEELARRYAAGAVAAAQKYAHGVIAAREREHADFRSHEPPRNSGEGAAVNGPTPLVGGDDANGPNE
jgi:hypothetical protein